MKTRRRYLNITAQWDAWEKLTDKQVENIITETLEQTSLKNVRVLVVLRTDRTKA